MISVIIPSYRNKNMLLKNLHSNIDFLKDLEIIVINDYPQESLKNELKNSHLALIENKKNLGFGQSVNKGVIKAKNKYILILNSDVKLINREFLNSVKHFKDNKKLFAIAFAQKEKGGLIVGKNKFFWRYGMFRHKANPNLSFGLNSWAEGGSSIIDRDKFLNLGGFDELYTPFYWEDIDLSYRAWKSGYEILFEPKIIVNHNHESTISAYFGKDYIKTVSYRNQFIFIWKNISDVKLLLEHILFFIPNMIYFLIKGELSYFKGLFNAVLKLNGVLNHKNKQISLYTLSDIDVLNKFK